MKARTLPDQPTLLIDEPDFRLVRVYIGENTEHILEVRDGVDALGTERWRKFEMSSQHLRNLFGYLVRVATKQQEQS